MTFGGLALVVGLVGLGGVVVGAEGVAADDGLVLQGVVSWTCE